jgi:MFS family permease
MHSDDLPTQPKLDVAHAGYPRALVPLLIAFLAVYATLETVIIPAVPLMQAALHATPAAIAWVFTGYLLAGTVTLPLVTRLADVRDKRPLLLAVFASVCVGAAVAGSATSVLQLAIGQTFQGVGISLVPLTVAIIRITQPDERKLKRATALAIGVGFLSNAVGFVAVGPITAVVSYRWLYWVPLAILILIVITAFRFIPRLPAPLRGRVDWAGVVLLGTGLTVLLLGITLAPDWGWTSPGFFSFVAVSLVLLAIFVWVERRVSVPLVDLHIGGRTVVAVCSIAVAVGFVWTSYQISIPTLTQAPESSGYGLGGTTTLTGLIMLPMGVAAAAAAPLVRPLRDWLGSRALMMVAGVLLMASVLVQMTGISVAALLAASVMLGVGLGISLTESLNVVVETMPVDRVASAGGLVFLLRNVGGTLGAQIGGSTLASSLLPGLPLPDWSGFMIVFAVAAVVGGVGAVLAAALPSRTAQLAVVPAL